MNKSLFEKCNVLLSLMTNNSSMNRISISNSAYVQISCVKHIPLLCRIWPDFIQKSSLFYQQSLGMIQTRVPNSQFSWWQDQSYSSANYVHCSAKLSVNVHNSQFPYVQLTSAVELSDFFVEGRHLSKIRLGANVTDVNCKVLSSIYPVLNSSSPISSSCCCCCCK